jgi:IS30 family transposase
MAGTRMTQMQQDQLWASRKTGRSISAVGNELHFRPSKVFAYLKRHGGIAPTVRSRALNRLSLAEREEISRGLSAGFSLRSIAALLHRSPSTISREVSSHGGREAYRAAAAEQSAWDRALRTKPCMLESRPSLCTLIEEKLTLCWVPRQIAGWLKITFPGDESMQVSHETIYKTLYLQTRGSLRKELTSYLRRCRLFRHGKNYTTKGSTRGQIVPSASVLPRLKTGLFPGTGKAI